MNGPLIHTTRSGNCKTYLPTSIYFARGSSADSITNLQNFDDGTTYTVVEANGAIGIDFVVTFSNIFSFRKFLAIDWYAGSSSHYIFIQFLNYERVVESGTAESGTVDTLTDTDKAFDTNEYRIGIIKTVAGTGAGQKRRIVSNDSDTFTVTPAWDVNPDNTTQYEIFYFVQKHVCYNEQSYETYFWELDRATAKKYVDPFDRSVDIRYVHPLSGNTGHRLYFDGFNLLQ